LGNEAIHLCARLALVRLRLTAALFAAKHHLPTERTSAYDDTARQIPK